MGSHSGIPRIPKELGPLQGPYPKMPRDIQGAQKPS